MKIRRIAYWRAVYADRPAHQPPGWLPALRAANAIIESAATPDEKVERLNALHRAYGADFEALEPFSPLSDLSAGEQWIAHRFLMDGLPRSDFFVREGMRVPEEILKFELSYARKRLHYSAKRAQDFLDYQEKARSGKAWRP